MTANALRVEVDLIEWQNLGKERDALRAENERLTQAYQEQVEHNRYTAEKHGEHIHVLSTENERLKTWAEAEQAERYKAEEQRTDERSTVALLEADNEWLRVELTHRVGWEERCLRAEARLAESEAENDQWQKKLAEVWAEVAELRKNQPPPRRD